MAQTRVSTASGQPAAVNDMGPDLARIDKEVRAFVQERPVLALLGAVAAGYLLGRVLRRRG